jgi:hypothetical protein
MADLASTQQGIYLTSDESTCCANGAGHAPVPVHLTSQGLTARVKALLMDRRVAVLLVVAPTQEQLQQALPLGMLDLVRVVRDVQVG